MKVLIVRAFPSVIDLQKSSYNQQEIGLAAGFLSLGNEAGIVYFGGNRHSDEIYETENGAIKIYYRRAKVLLNRISLFEDFSDLKEEYDVIISNEYDQIETFKTVMRYAEKTVIYHGPYYSPFNKRYNLANKIFDILFAKSIQRKKPCIVTKSGLAKDFLERKGFCVSGSVGVGLDSAQLLSKEERNPLEEKLTRKNIHLLYIGRLEPRRNILFLLEVLEKLVHLDTRYRMVLVGKGEDQYVQEVFATIDRKNLREFVIYQESMSQPQLPWLYRNCDFFLLPTAYEIWGMVMMEAMQFNCPVITTRNGGSESLIISGQNGEILDLNSETWVDTILEASFDMDLLSSCNRALLEDKCDWQNIAKKILEAFQYSSKENDRGKIDAEKNV